MWEFDCGCIPVIKANGDGHVIGVITDRDIAMAAYTQGQQLWAVPITSAMAHEVIACHTSDGISQAEALMRDNRVRRLPVLDQHERLAVSSRSTMSRKRLSVKHRPANERRSQRTQ